MEVTQAPAVAAAEREPPKPSANNQLLKCLRIAIKWREAVEQGTLKETLTCTNSFIEFKTLSPEQLRVVVEMTNFAFRKTASSSRVIAQGNRLRAWDNNSVSTLH